MYSIRIRINYRLDAYCQGDKANIGVRLKNGEFRFYPWGGFTLEMVHPVKTKVDSFTLEEAWNPRSKGSKMPQYEELKKGEFLLGSFCEGMVYTVLPFKVIE